MADKPASKAAMLALTADLVGVFEKHLGAKPARLSVYFADDEFMELTLYMCDAGFESGMGLPPSVKGESHAPVDVELGVDPNGELFAAAVSSAPGRVVKDGF